MSGTLSSRTGTHHAPNRFAFVWLLLPETAGRSIFEIEQVSLERSQRGRRDRSSVSPIHQMYQAGLSARQFKTYDTSKLVAEKQKELGIDVEKPFDQDKLDKMEADDKDREISHFEDSRGQAFA